MTMTQKTWTHSGTLKKECSKRELEHGTLARKAAGEGIVLLKNDGVLPLKATEKVALFGAGADKTVKGGIGSGDVNNRKNVSIYEGLHAAGVSISSKAWLEDYDFTYNQARQQWKEVVLQATKTADNPFDAYALNPFLMPEGRDIKEEDLQGATVGIYVISRIAGEGKDRRLEKGDYYLSEKEEKDILYLNEKNIPIVLIINAGGPVELTDMLKNACNIKGIINISQLGQEGGLAVAHVLLGNVVPSGKLTATWAKSYDDYPYAKEYSYLNGNLQTEEYKDGIYVGYRYFDSFQVEPLFSFGYGLSYTTFDIGLEQIVPKNNQVELMVKVENTGDTFAGKEVVQVYVELPKGKIEKEYRRLACFKKTKNLEPKECQVLTLSINQKQLASFFEDAHSWVVEAGNYGVWIGNSLASAKKVANICIEKEVVLEHTKTLDFMENVHINQLSVSHIEVKNDFKQGTEAIQTIDFIPQKVNRKQVDVVWKKELTKDCSIEELIPLLYGNITDDASMLGSAGIRVPGSAGETTEKLENSHGIFSLIMADGPAGLRLRQSYEVDRETDTVYSIGFLAGVENGFLEPMEHHENADVYYQYCTAFPVGTALAQTWNEELIKEIGEAVGVEMQEFQVNLWLAPGMNIQKNPLCGRNFEYYSEDPFVSGCIAKAMTEGVQTRKGCGVTIKHFACNNQEDNRMGVNAIVSERALREIYLRGFEIVVTESNPVAIMTSYNLINGVHAANSKELCTVIAREEWGFDGAIMSDWNTTVPEDGSIPWKCVAAGNDIIMPGNHNDHDNILKAYKEGLLTEEEIRACAGRIIAMEHKLKK